MALAILRFEGSDGERARFRVEVGGNRYYSYAIGDGEVDRSDGIPVLRNRTFTSPLLGPLPEELLGRTELEVPLERFGRDHRHVQLMSFRTRDLVGPAISDIVRIPRVRAGEGELPVLTFGMGTLMERQAAPAEAVPFRYREVRPVSSAMFLQGLISALPSLLPVVGSVIGSLAGGGAGAAPSGRGAGGGGAATAPAGLLQAIARPETAEAIARLLEQIARLAGGGTSRAAGARSLSRGDGYSQATMAPALLAAIPALLPLLQQVLNPETLKTILGSIGPDRLIGTVTNGILDLGRLGAQIQQQEREHLRALNPGVDDPALHQLLAGMSLSLAASPEPAYRRVESVEVAFAEHVPLIVHGRPRVCYRHGEEISFPLDLSTPRPIRGATLHLRVKDPATLEVLAERTFPVDGLVSGRISVVPSLAPEQARSLRPGEDYLVCAALVWKNGRGERIGTSRAQLVTLMGEYTFDGVEPAGEPIPLDDAQKFRDFWHKAWQDSFTAGVKQFTFDCKYYYVLEAERTANGRMDTETQSAAAGSKREEGRLRSGLAMSPYALNDLLPRISDAPPLGEAELAALGTREFTERLHLAARHRVFFRGRVGDSAALWIFPEVRLHEVLLRRAVRTDALGQVRELAEHRVRFPFPVLTHFIGTRSRR